MQRIAAWINALKNTGRCVAPEASATGSAAALNDKRARRADEARRLGGGENP
jgi:hypothetical protein